MITIDKSGTSCSFTEKGIESLRKDFQTHHFCRLPDLIDSALLEELYSQIVTADWQQMIHEGIGTEVCLNDPGTVALINFLLNDQQLFEIIQAITVCKPIGCFQGRVYRMIPDSGHHDSWHSDFGEDRLLALSLNLGKEQYEGGVLEIQKNDALIEVPNPQFGDAVLFQISRELKHRVTNVEGSVPKTAFAGWFKSSPDLWSTLTELSQSNQTQPAP